MRNKTTPNGFNIEECWHCGEESTRRLSNGVFMCDSSQCMLEEISTQTREYFGEDE